MSILEERSKTAEAIAKGRFVNHVLKSAVSDIDENVKEKTNSFSSAFWKKRKFSVNNTTLSYTTLLQHRFVDMKTRQTNTGTVKKKRHQIHNKPIYGQLNNIVRELSFGFTDAIKSKFQELEK